MTSVTFTTNYPQVSTSPPSNTPQYQTPETFFQREQNEEIIDTEETAYPGQATTITSIDMHDCITIFCLGKNKRNNQIEIAAYHVVSKNQKSEDSYKIGIIDFLNKLSDLENISFFLIGGNKLSKEDSYPIIKSQIETKFSPDVIKCQLINPNNSEYKYISAKLTISGDLTYTFHDAIV